MLVGSAFAILAILATSIFYPYAEDGEVVTIESVVRERDEFEARHPLKSRPNNGTNFAKRIDEDRARGRLYAATSVLEGKSIVVQGYWNVNPFEGYWVESETQPHGDNSLLLRPGSNFRKSRPSSPLERFRFLLREPVFLEPNDFVRISGVFHATGYGRRGEFSESWSWVEFVKVERWDRGSSR